MNIISSFTLLLFSVVVCCFSLPCNVFAADRVVVLPLKNGKTVKNIITVTTADGQFSDPVAAVSSITDASEFNPYLVFIGPGKYTLTTTLEMKPYVDVSGSGENVTLLAGSIYSSTDDATSAIVKVANNATLSNLSILNTGSYSDINERGIGIYTTGLNSTAKIQNVKITVTGSVRNYGVYNKFSSSPTMTDIDVIAEAGMGLGGYRGWDCIGVKNFSSSSPTITRVNAVGLRCEASYGVKNDGGSSPVMTDMNANGFGGIYGYGISNTESSPTINNVSVTATGGISVFGVENKTSSSPLMTGVNIAVSDGGSSYGVNNLYSSPTMTDINITVSGTTSSYGVYNAFSSPTMTQVNVAASGGSSSNYGIYNDSSSAVKIRRCTLEGDTDGLIDVASTSTISQSSIIGGVAGTGHTCIASDNGAGVPLDNTCL